MNRARSSLGYAALLGICSALCLASCGDSGSDNSTESSSYQFASDPPSAYTQIDRHAAVEAGTVGIAATAGLGIAPIRDEYNASNPQEDAAGVWLSEISASVTALHGALDDDLTAAGLAPASVAQSLAQAGPVIVPDTIKYNPDLPTGYPNGRRLKDQVVDRTIAAALLALGTNGQTIDTLANLPLNPPANDVSFKARFPYLADPHPAD